MEEEPGPPPTGWTLGEAAAALLPDLLAAADGLPPRNWWMAGGAEYKATERAALYRAFARIMEAGSYRATGLVKRQEQPIVPALWRAARFGLGLPRERVPDDTLYVGGRSFQGVRVNRPRLDSGSCTLKAAEAGNESQVPGPGVVWWTACEAFTWVAFGKARKLVWQDAEGNERWMECMELPTDEWAVDWKQPPKTGLSRAFIAIATEKKWTLEEWGSRGEAHYLGWAQAIMRDTGESPERLHALLTEHNEQHERNNHKLRQAWRDLMTAVREGRLTIRARLALPNGKPDIDALYEMLDAAKVFGTHVINLHGKVDYAGNNGDQAMTTTSLETLFDYKGPRWDDAEFVAGQVQTIWPAQPRVKQGLLEAMTFAAEIFTAKRGGKPKRDALVADCLANPDLKCSVREARAAYARLPSHLRRGKGESN